MKTVMFIGDLHLSSTPPASRIDDYAEAIFQKLEQCYGLIDRMKIDAVVQLGDAFHLKTWSRTPYWLTLRYMRWLKRVHALGCEVGVIVGNHDVPYGNDAFVDRQPMGMVLSLDFVKSSPADLVLQDPDIRIVLKNFNSDFTVRDLNVARESEKFLVCCCHQSLMKTGQLFGEPTVNFHEVKTEADVIAFGHLHAPMVLQKEGEILFVNPGALSRGSLHSENLERDINVIVLKFDEKIKFKAIKLDAAPANQVFDLELHEREKARDEEVGEFVEVLKTVSSAVVGSDPLVILNSLEVSPAVKTMARTYLDGDSIDMELM